jgi:hypothetical protein
LLAYIWLACRGHAAGQVAQADHARRRPPTSSSGREPSTLPPVSTAMSTTTLPGFMPRDHVGGDDARRLAAEDLAVVMTMSELAQALAIASRCFSSCSGVSALA